MAIDVVDAVDAVDVVDHETERDAIYGRYRHGWVPAKMRELSALADRTGYDWMCIQAPECRGLFAPGGQERCANCLGKVMRYRKVFR